MRNVIEWFKNHSPLDYVLVLLIILIGVTIFKLPSAISNNYKHKAQFASVYKEFNEEWNHREKAGTLPSNNEDKPKALAPKAKSTDELMANFLKAENDLIATYYAQNAGQTSEDMTSNVAYNEKRDAFKNELTPKLSGGTLDMVFQEPQLEGYTLTSSKLTPKGNQTYEGIFTATSKGQAVAYITYTYDSKTNTVGNLSVNMKTSVLEKVRK